MWGPDRYVSSRRALIYLKESLRRSTQFAIFENNDANLWSALRQTANRILQPMWEAGGLKGVSTAEAYFIRCDSTINTPQVIASGEVRMLVGVALQYPAEFIIIRISQYDSGGSLAAEV
jgi:phage tail sheath protein FI